jgi:hypothetical protein
MIDIIENKTDWNNLLKEMNSYDFYHSYDYHHILKKDNETPILILYSKEDCKIAIPFLKRKVLNTKYFDLTSVHGYLGPITNKHEILNFISNFQEELHGFLFKNNFISAFSKLNSFIELQTDILNNLGTITNVGVQVYFDLTETIEDQRSAYQKSLKRQINKIKRSCYVKKATTHDEINTFINIYYENMDRIGADRSFYYPKEYFYHLMACDLFDIDIYLIALEETDEIISGSFFVKCPDIIQCELTGTKSDFLFLSPSKAGIDQMRIDATTEGTSKFLNLGGGIGGLNGPLVSRYKLPFSKKIKPLNVWKYIVNEQVYSELTKDLREQYPDIDFFPLYRYQN